MTDYTGDSYIYDGQAATGNVVSTAVPFAHSALSGLGADDHPQYHNDARGDLRYWQLSTDLATQAELNAAIALLVAKTTTITINGVAFDLSANRSWSVTGGQGMTQTTADNTGATDATAQLQADATVANATASKRLYLPAGTYKIAQVGGTILSLATDNLEVFGDGIGKTIIQLPANTTLTSALIFFKLTGKHQWIRDLSIQIGSGTAGSFDITGIAIDQGAFYSRLTRIEASGIYGSSTAGGAGITTYQPYNQSEVSTTLGTTIASGAQTVTPPSMIGIYKGRTLTIGGTAEDVVVTAITATTFTATFANAHNSTDTVVGTSNARQFALIEDCIVRDSYQASGFVINSAANTIRRCIALHVGSTTAQHGYYVQAAQNDFINCKAEGVRGYSYHQHIATNVTDASGNRYIGCESIDPGTQHFIADSSTSNGTNPDVPNTAQLARYTIVANCLFRRTKGAGACEGVRIDYGGVIQGNTFEDATGGGSAWIYGGTNNIVQGNVLRVLNTGNTGLGIIGSGNSVIAGNQFINWSGAAAIRVDGACTMQANSVDLKGNQAIVINASNAVAFDNLINASAGSPIVINNPSLTNINFKNNEIICSGSATIAIDFQAATFMPTTSVFANNRWTGNSCYCRYYDSSNTLQWINNRGLMAFRGNATQVLVDEAAGRLLAFPKGTNTLTAALLVKIASGAVVTIGTGDTVFFGAATSTTDATNNGVYIVGQPGSEATIACDGAWTAGNVAIVSTTSAGKVHDNGTSVPAAPASYGYFLDTGGGAGNARVLLVKTL